jgi:hypothetical protein
LQDNQKLQGPYMTTSTSVSAATLTQAILTWWKDAERLTTGPDYSYNVFDTSPDFVDLAQAGIDATESALQDVARRILAWWKDAQYMVMGPYGSRNVFDWDPDIVDLAREVLGIQRGEAF